MKSSDIRTRFLRFFEQHGHTVAPSASLLLDDPNLLFVNAGMVQFKPYLLGQVTPPYPRATTVQKCVRTIDIDEVGKTTRHGTFFQMNGNFSFGDYFKETAIPLAWELSTKPQSEGGLGFDESRIWVTVYLDDDEAADIWTKQVGIPAERVQRLGMADNYWSMGVPGPCGPCSELFFDRGPEYGPDGGPAKDTGGDRFLEFWNLVFMQYERGPGEGKTDFPILGPLPSKNIDTGMGLERVAFLLQGVDNMYEIDEVWPVIERASALTGVKYGADHDQDVRFRVIGDHVRSALMLIADGVTPSNEGRGYVLRRIIRRAVRAIRLLGVDRAALPELLPVSRDCMKSSYPEVETDFARISQYAYAEEEAFLSTLKTGTTILDTAVAQTKAAGGSTLSGDQAFTLHDTYGFPIDLTLEMAGEQGLAVDQEGFKQLMAQQRQRAKEDAKARKTGHADTSAYRDVLDRVGPSVFTGYEELTTDGTVQALFADGGAVGTAGEGQIVELVLDRTPFYAESGGQHADAGTIVADGVEVEVLDVQKVIKGLIAHQVRVIRGELRPQLAVSSRVDPEWRLGACQAHSGTHVLHAALRQVLGPTALQSGSFNRPGYLRLDFSWPSSLSDETVSELEEVVNLAVRRDLPVRALYTSLPDAKAMGALALFGETYDEEVRVVEIGGPWSRELCGGTHVAGSAQIGPLAITGESSVGAGSRRVEAVVGIEAFRYLNTERALLTGVLDELGVRREHLIERVRDTVDRLRQAERQIERLRREELTRNAGDLAAKAQDVNGVAVVSLSLPDGLSANDIRSLAVDVRGRIQPSRPAVVALIGAADGKVSFVAAANEAARGRGVNAGDVVKALAPAVDGRGGGKPDLAQGGGTKPAGADEAVAAVIRFVAERA
jgi:alanyl-tRNA synthetase